MKLTIEQTELLYRDLCQRLPFGVKAIWTDLGADKRTKEGKGILTDIVGLGEVETFGQQIFTKDSGGIGFSNYEEIKPILRPLSDLTKEIEHNGEKFVPMLKLLELDGKANRDINACKFDGSFIYEEGFHYGRSINGKKNTDWAISMCIYPKGIKHWVANQLLQWHFDINGLIEQGLAIDVNTLKENPYK